MDIEQLRDYCLSKPDVEESFPFGPDILVFKVHTILFCLTVLDSAVFSFNVKCDPEKAIDLRERYSAIEPGFHMNKKHWNTVTVDGRLKDELLKECIDDSYMLCSMKKNKRKK